MHVQPEALAEELLRDEHPVAGDDDNARLAGEGGELVRLLDRDLEALRDFLRRRRGLLSPSALGLVRAREEELDVVAPAGHPFEHGRTERRGGRNGDFHG